MIKQKGGEDFPPHIGRLILRKASAKDHGFSPWMKKYLSAKEYHAIRVRNLQSPRVDELKRCFDQYMSLRNIIFNKQDFEYLLRQNNRLGLTLLLLRASARTKSISSITSKNKILIQIFESRLHRSREMSLSSPLGNHQLQQLSIIAPVCPDYSYIRKQDNTYRYTFESVGDGIGLVAQKAISNLGVLDNMSIDIINNGLAIQNHVLVGDFEAHELNLQSLNESEMTFMHKVSSSAEAIRKTTHYDSSLFTSICLGLEGWHYHIKYLKYIYNLNHFDDLKCFAPHVNHDKNLISRLPLYRKWFGDDFDYKKIFFDQCVEYALMGSLVRQRYGVNAVLLASDHKAMRHYYSLLSEIAVISSSSNY